MSKQSVLFLLLVFLLVTSCDSYTSQLRDVYNLAGENKKELQIVLNHYKNDKQKLVAAKFLLTNMFHFSAQGHSFEIYRNTIIGSDSLLEYDKLWLDINNAQREDRVVVYDAKTITADYLIRNIDQAFCVWESAPWYNQVDFESFCNYILPYRVLDEPVSDWRLTLNQKYSSLIEGVECPKEAYEIVHQYILKEFKNQNHNCPYAPDVMMLNKMLEGTCSHECIYAISALRSLGIPATYDMVYYWANYSQGGHSWVSYGIDSLIEEKVVDPSTFLAVRYNISNFRHRVDSVKKKSKIYRKKYKAKFHKDKYRVPKLLFFNDPFLEDVSAFYGYDNKVEFGNKGKQQLFLCTFASIKNWQPVIKGTNKSGITVFDNIGSDIVYLPVYFSGEFMIPIENPFILYNNGTKETLSPDTLRREKVVLRRKYLLFSHWLNRWSKIIGSGIDVSNDPAFNCYSRLYDFTEMPDGITKVNVEASTPYRYIRFQAPLEARPNIAEMKFYGVCHGDTALLTGTVICEDIDLKNAQKAFDNDYSTYTQTPHDNYWFGLDLGLNNKFTLSHIEYCMRHDMNMVEVGDQYELFYYDYGWHSLGSQIASCDSLIYNNVPSHSLLWLRNHTKGREERIFTYQDGKQIWW